MAKFVVLTEEQQKLVVANIPLARRFARKRYRRHGLLTYNEILSAAYFGLIFAAGNFVPNQEYDPKNERWPLYAIRCIDGAILDEIAHQGLIAVPANMFRPYGKKALARAKTEMYNAPSLKPRGRGSVYDCWKWLDAERAMRVFKRLPTIPGSRRNERHHRT